MRHLNTFEKHVFVYGTLKNPDLARKVLGHYAPYKTETAEGDKENIHTYKRKKVKLSDHDLAYYYRLKRNQFNEMQSTTFEDQLDQDLPEPDNRITIEIPSTGMMLSHFGGKCNILLDGEEIGHVTIDSLTAGETKLWNFLIYDGYKNKGYGSQALKAIEKLLVRLGVRSVKLGVVLSNTRAQKFYARNGYKVTDSDDSRSIWYYKDLISPYLAVKSSQPQNTSQQ